MTTLCKNKTKALPTCIPTLADPSTLLSSGINNSKAPIANTSQKDSRTPRLSTSGLRSFSFASSLDPLTPSLSLPLTAYFRCLFFLFDFFFSSHALRCCSSTCRAAHTCSELANIRPMPTLVFFCFFNQHKDLSPTLLKFVIKSDDMKCLVDN